MTTPPPTGPDSTPIPPSSPNASQAAATDSQAAQSTGSANQTAVRDLATVMSPVVELYQTAIKGKVTAVALTASPPTCSVQMQGDTSVTIDGVRMLDAYSPVVGDTVLMGKQGPDVWIQGQMNDSGSGSANGWTAPTLGSGFTTNGGFGPLEYRIVVDNGDLKMQWRGSVAIAGAASAVCTMPSGARPSSSRSLVLARQQNQGAVAIRCDFASGGGVVLFGETATADVAVSTTNTTPGDTGIQNADHTHNYLGVTHVNPAAQDPNIHTHGLVDASVTHVDVQNSNHAHNSATHNHGTTVTVTQDPPDWVSFNGIEYFM